MGPIWGRQDPGGPHDGLMNFAIWNVYCTLQWNAGGQNWSVFIDIVTIAGLRKRQGFPLCSMPFPCWLLGTKMQYFLCTSNGDVTVLCWAISVQILYEICSVTLCDKEFNLGDQILLIWGPQFSVLSLLWPIIISWSSVSNIGRNLESNETINSSPPGQNGCHFGRWHFQMHFLEQRW